MGQAELVARLVAADDAERAKLLEENSALLDTQLARSLRSAYYDARDSDLVRARAAASCLARLAEFNRAPEIQALALWMNGIVALELDGQAEEAIARLEEASSRFDELGQPLEAASTQVALLYALAMLGRYDEAIECGLRARDLFIAHNDLTSTGKIEQNLGNIYYRRDRYREAEMLYRSSRARFEAAGDDKQFALIDTNLATSLIYQYKFNDAEELYREALARAEKTGLVVVQAIIECDLGCLELFRGRYKQALEYLEKSRRRYATLGMMHESAIAEQELADAYLELNLAPEAAEIYSRIIPLFAHLGMRAEQARALACHGRACLLMGRIGESLALLSQAQALYANEGNRVGEAIVTLTEAQIRYAEKDFAAASSLALRAEGPLLKAGSRERLLLARWLAGESLRAMGNESEAWSLLAPALNDADEPGLPQIAYRCHTSLGLLAMRRGDFEEAEKSFDRAIGLIEDLRAMLPTDEFRTAFLTDKLTPYVEAARLCLRSGKGRVEEAFAYVERSRSRALVDMLGSDVRFHLKPRDQFEAGLMAEVEALREELNWLYTRLNRPLKDDGPRTPEDAAALRQAVGSRENRVLEILRQLQQCADAALIQAGPLDLSSLQHQLDSGTALVEYFSLDRELLAFVITGESVEVVRNLAREEKVEAAIERLRFQINSFRYGAHLLRKHSSQLTLRTRHYLGALYDMLLRPLENHLGSRRLVVVPHRALHYVPFHALFDGRFYVIEQREVCYAPSAGVLIHCLGKPRRKAHNALLLGVADAQAPRVRDEVEALAPLFPRATTLLDNEATLRALEERASSADVLHLACHGQFRADNPLFSSLHLADGWLTVGDAYKLDLSCEIVTLSACETGKSDVAPGDELTGLARGFFFAGAPSLIVSLWTVADEETALIMKDFYARLLAGASPASALRSAQCRMLEDQPHPFFWSPFVLLGRW